MSAFTKFMEAHKEEKKKLLNEDSSWSCNILYVAIVYSEVLGWLLLVHSPWSAQYGTIETEIEDNFKDEV